MTTAFICPTIVRDPNPFGCFQRGLSGSWFSSSNGDSNDSGGSDPYMVPPIDVATGVPIYPLAQWRMIDKKMRKALTREQDQLNEERLDYLRQVKKEEGRTAKIMDKQLLQAEAKVATEMIETGAVQSAFGGSYMTLLPVAGIVLLVLFLRRKK